MNSIFELLHAAGGYFIRIEYYDGFLLPLRDAQTITFDLVVFNKRLL